MKQISVVYVASQALSGHVRIDGGLQGTRPGAPDAVITIGDTTYRVYITGFKGDYLSPEVRRLAIEQLPEVLASRPADLDDM